VERPVGTFGKHLLRDRRQQLLRSGWFGDGPNDLPRDNPGAWGTTVGDEGRSDGLGDLRQASIGLAVPSKAIGEYGDPLHTAVPFASQHRARPHLRGLPFDLDRAFASVFRRAGCIEQPLTFGIKVTQPIGLDLIR